MWDGINAQFITLREKILHENTFLQHTDNFWEALYKLLESTATPEVGELIKLREQREELAQQRASQKLHALKTILGVGNSQGKYRRIIFDYARQWTPVLLKQLNASGLQVVELAGTKEETERLWNSFEQGKQEVMITSHLPQSDLRPLPIHQLIIMPPCVPCPKSTR